MKLLIDISDNAYNAIMARDWKNAGWLFSDGLKAIHDGKPFVEVLQEIREEIEKTVSRYAISRERGTMGQVEWSDRLIKESDVFAIIDKHLEQYKEDAECTEKSEK